MHVFFMFFISRLKMHARCVSWARVWVWGEKYLGTSPAVWEHRYLCYESGARVWSEGSLGFRVLVNLSHRFCLDWATMSWTGRPCLGMFLLIFETFLGGALRHNVYMGYKVFWGTIIYCSLASVYVLDGTRDITLRYIYVCNSRLNQLTLILICKQHDRQITFVRIKREQKYGGMNRSNARIS